MPPTLFLASHTDTALAHLREQLLGFRSRDPLTPVHLLVPDQALMAHLRSHLGAGLNVRLHQFFTLSRTLLAAADLHFHSLRESAVRRLLHRILADLQAQGQLSTFAPVWDKPGFNRLMADWLREMKSQGIDPHSLQHHAHESGLARDRQLAQIYSAYQDFLHSRRASDDDGLLWLAADALAADPGLFTHPGPCFVYGFDQFNPMQRRILAHLAPRFSGFALYLRWDPDRSAAAPALTRMATTRQQLTEELHLTQMILPMTEPHTQDAGLQRIGRGLFEGTAPKIPAAQLSNLVWIEAPSREQEVRRVLRDVKTLLLRGIPASQIAVLAPAPSAYAPLLRTVAREYGLPIRVPQALAANPAVSALLNLLRLAPDFPRRETLGALRSPYVRLPWLNPDQVDRLDRLSRDRPVIAGRDQWRFALQEPAPTPDQAIGDADDERSGPPQGTPLGPADLTAMRGGIEFFFDHLTPPAAATHRAYALWIQEALLGLWEPEPDDAPPDEPPQPGTTLDLVACCREGPFAQRDLAALARFLGCLRELIQAVDFLRDREVAETIPWATFRDEVLAMVAPITLAADEKVESVAFGPLEAGRAVTVDYLYLLGLSEGEFPTPPPPDPLYDRQERATHPLPLRPWQSGDDASLWWQVVTGCRRRLTLVRPYVDENGALWPPSAYWSPMLEQIEGAAPDRIPIAEIVAPTEAAGEDELLLALAAQGAGQVPAQLEIPWRLAHGAYALERRRAGWQAPGIFEGILASPPLLAELANGYGPNHVWSASRLNRYANCPYGFFAEHILRLEPCTDPQEGLDARRRGSLLHEIQERLFRELTRREMSLHPQGQEAILALLDACCAHVFADAPMRFGFRPTALWPYEQAELRRLLAALLRWELTQPESATYYPYRQEMAFGIQDSPPVWIEGDEGAGFLLRGFIDRIDRSREGHLRIVDYKSSSTPYSAEKDVASGLALQTVLYARAAALLLGEEARVVRSEYLHIPSRKIGGKVDFDRPDKAMPVVEQALAAAVGAVGRVRRGIFPAAPAKSARNGDACSEHCELARLCRPSRGSRRKAHRFLEPEP